METISIKIQVSRALHQKLIDIQKKLRKQTGKKKALAEILLNFALKGMQNNSTFEQNSIQNVQNDLLSCQNLSQKVQNQRLQLLIKDIKLLKQQWQERFELLEQMQEDFYKREQNLYTKENLLKDKRHEIENFSQTNTEQSIKLRLYETELSNLRKERAELLSQINRLSDNYSTMQNVLQEILSEQKNLSHHLQYITKTTDIILSKQTQNNGLLDKLISLSPLAMYVLDKWKGREEGK